MPEIYGSHWSHTSVGLKTGSDLANFLEIPPGRLDAQVLAALLEEFASRDGTDYGEVETDMPRRVAQLQAQLTSGEMALLFDSDSEQWDLVSRDQAAQFLTDSQSGE